MSVVPRTGIFRYVRHSDAETYCQLGWSPIDALEGTHHGDYAVLMMWLCECKAAEPRKSDDAQVQQMRPA